MPYDAPATTAVILAPSEAILQGSSQQDALFDLDNNGIINEDF